MYKRSDVPMPIGTHAIYIIALHRRKNAGEPTVAIGMEGTRRTRLGWLETFVNPNLK